jgi:hypothetical protein
MRKTIIAIAVLAGIIYAFLCAREGYQSLVYDYNHRNDEVEVSVGKFTSWDAAVSASLQKLSQEIRQHPGAKRYRIYFRQSIRDRHGIGGAVLYVPANKQIGFENDPGSGFVAYWTNIDNFAINAAAATNGTFKSFGQEAWYSEISYAP